MSKTIKDLGVLRAGSRVVSDFPNLVKETILWKIYVPYPNLWHLGLIHSRFTQGNFHRLGFR